jgi:hypothetical protein
VLPDHHNPGHASDWQARLFSELIASRVLACLASLAMSGPLRNVPGVKNSLFRHAEEVYSLAGS